MEVMYVCNYLLLEVIVLDCLVDEDKSRKVYVKPEY